MAAIGLDSVRIVNETEPREEEQYGDDKYEGLRAWVMARVEKWRQVRDSNFAQDWDTYERLWRGIWAPNERLRESERSRIITPALSEAVENAAAEIEEAVFGRGADYFDVEVDEFALKPDGEDEIPAPDPAVAAQMGLPVEQLQRLAAQQAAAMKKKRLEDAERLRRSLREDLQRSDFTANVVEVVLYSAVFGTGFGEIVFTEQVVHRPTPDGLATEAVLLRVPSLRALSPRNVLTDPAAKRIEDGLAVAVEETVPFHLLLAQQKSGAIRADVDLDECLHFDASEDETGRVDGKSQADEGAVRVIRWYGKVPTHLLNPQEKPSKDEADVLDAEAQAEEEYDDADLTEAIVVIVNKAKVVKAVPNPAPRADRPVVYFPWDIVPGRLHGRGICEKGANSQKILDAEVRARLDGLALTWAPMVGIDATRIPRGMQFVLRPGGTLLTQGPPRDTIEPLKIGALDPNHWQNAQALQAMVHQATGSLDATALANSVGDARSGAVSMAMAPVIKRYKRTLVRFFDLFLMPALDKIVSRAQQAMPRRYPAIPVRLRPASTMGIMQREYETMQLTQLLASLQPGTPEHTAVLLGVIGNTSVPNRETIMRLVGSAAARAQAQAEQAQSPAAMQVMQAGIQLDMAEKQAKVRKLQAEAAKAEIEAQLLPRQLQLDIMQTATKGLYNVPSSQQDDEFNRRMALADKMLQARKIEEAAKDRASNERIALTQMAVSAREKEKDRQAKLAAEMVKNRRNQQKETSAWTKK